MILLIDGSNNVQLQDWEPLKSWVSDFISDFSEQVAPNYAQTSTVVVVQYSNHDNYWVKKRDFDQLKKLEEDFKGMFQFGERSDTFAALEFVLQDVTDEDFASKLRSAAAASSMSSSRTSKKALILITNGLADDYLDHKNRVLSNQQVYDQLNNTFDLRTVIGIGSEISGEAESIRKISDGSEDSFMLVDDIGHLDGSVIERIVERFGR